MVQAWYRIHAAFWTMLVVSLGYALGTFGLVVERTGSPPPLAVLQEDVHRPISIVHIREINNGSITGTVGEGARLMIGDTVITASAETEFRTPAAPFLVDIIDIPIPHGALFVASKRGKNYYPVESSAGSNLAPENRLYFRGAADAEAMGYKKGR